MKLPNLERAAELGRALRRVRDSILKQDPTGRTTRIWFQGPEPYLDALFEESGGGLTWFPVTLRGRALTWDVSRGFIVTGHTGELTVDDPLAPASKTIVSDADSEREVVEVVWRMLAARAGEAPFDAAAAVLARWLEGR